MLRRFPILAQGLRDRRRSLVLWSLGVAVYITYDPNGLLSGFTTMPIQIFNWTSAPQEEFKTLAAATSILLLIVLLGMNAIAIYIRNKTAKRW